MPAATPDAVLETNAYAISYRLLGDRPAGRAVAGIAAERLRQVGGMSRPDWMYLLVEFTLNQTIEPGALAIAPNADDPYTGLRTALRRRLERAAPDERVAGALLHLGGYPIEFVASVVNRSIEQTVALAGVLAPPPGIDYRDLGDPELTRRTPVLATRGQRRRPHWTTVVVTVLVLLALIVATQLTGPRPTLGPPPTEGGLGVEAPAPVPPDALGTATG